MAERKFIFIDCSEAAKTCNKKQYAEATASEKVRMLLHLVFCKHCRQFSVKNNKLTRLIHLSDIKLCTEEEKKVLKKKIEEELTK